MLSLPILETKATCEACIQVPPYKEDLKCCTFHPFLTNYLVGQILSDQEQNPTFIGDVLRQKMTQKSGVLPLGVAAPERYVHDYQASGFGQNEKWLCPYFDRTKKHCGIWRHRGSVCTSFYCQSSQGVRGFEFWGQALEFFNYLEMALSQEALVYLDFSPRQIQEQLQFLTDQNRAPLDFHKVWNHYNDPGDFYQKTLEIVQSFDRKHVEQLLGDEGQMLEQQVMASGKIWVSK